MNGSTRQRSIVLILARDLASTLATPVLLVDAEGAVVFYNDAAGELLGRAFVEAQTMTREAWASAFEPMDEEGAPIESDEMPLGIALSERRPVHRVFTIRGGGARRRIEVTAFPLYASADELVGGMAVFWGNGEGS